MVGRGSRRGIIIPPPTLPDYETLTAGAHSRSRRKNRVADADAERLSAAPGRCEQCALAAHPDGLSGPRPIEEYAGVTGTQFREKIRPAGQPAVFRSLTLISGRPLQPRTAIRGGIDRLFEEFRVDVRWRRSSVTRKSGAGFSTPMIFAL